MDNSQTNRRNLMPDYYRLDAAETLAQLNTDPKTGLTSAEAAKRLAEVGPNALPHEEGTNLLALFLSQFKNLMVIILLIAAVISLVLGDVKDVVVIMVIAILNAALGTYQEYRAEQALAALGAMQVPHVRIRRNGEVHTISAEDLVPGDLVILGEGDKIPADGRLIEAVNLQIEEAALTGESQPVEKTTKPIGDENVGIGDRKNMVFMGTAVNYGRGEMVVTGTGLKTELGKIATMLMGVEETQTPLQRRINRLGQVLVQGAIGVVALVFVVGLLRGVEFQHMLITAISLAVAAVPEGLPAIITIGLSLGASRMVKRNALIRRLPAVETLGSVTTICSDKTGTLTKNEMTATLLSLPDQPDIQVTGIGYKAEGQFQVEGSDFDPKANEAVGRFLRAMALSTDAYLEHDTTSDKTSVVGDTTEGALLVAARKGGWTRTELEEDLPRVAELPFSSERKAMTTIHQVKNQAIQNFTHTNVVSITKGAPDKLIEWAAYEQTPEGARDLTDERRAAWQRQVDKMASEGLRVLGIAYRPLEEVPTEVKPEVERDLYLLGLVGILDPARPEAKAAVQTAKSAGIRSIMITGDHALTAEAIARDLGILLEGQKAVTGTELDKMDDGQLAAALRNTSAFARVSPEHKLRLVKVLQAENQIVAMTGDGVNDAPALKQADIGVAMGITGTEVSKGAADMVLTDDNFASIVAAVEEGRVIYDNIRKFVRYLLSSNVGEILVMFVALLVGMPIPLLAIQILWVNLVTDGLPAIALGFEPGEPGVMKRKPRPPQESIFAHGMGARILWMAVVLAVVTLGSYVWGYTSHDMNPFSPTLGLEHLNAEAVAHIAGAENVPENWDTLSAAQRVELMGGAEGGGQFSVEEGEGNGLLEAAERIPRTIAFTVLALGQIFHVSAIHAGDDRSFFREWFKRNMFLFWAVVSTFLLQLAVIYIPFLQHTFETAPLSAIDMLGSVILASLTLIAVEVEKFIRGLIGQPKAAARAGA
jgi:P-type Ca2+ transporter type 2C